MIQNKTIYTQRLVCEPLSLKHASNVYLNWLNDPEVYRYLESRGNYTMKKLKNYLENIEEKQVFAWAICNKDSGAHIGNIKIDPIDEINKYGEYGIMIGDKKSWGKGFAKEASVEIIRFCFEVLDLRKINLGVISPNLNAIKLYTSLGFEVEGIFKKHKLFESNYCDVIRMSLFRN